MKALKHIIIFFVTAGLFSCKPPVVRWMDGLADFRQTRDKDINLQLARIKQANTDTAALYYKVRIYLEGKAAESKGYNENLNFYYHMDSCFTIRAGGQEVMPVVMQPVNNGIANCFEYLVSFRIDPAIRLRTLELVYRDRFIDGKKYVLNLN